MKPWIKMDYIVPSVQDGAIDANSSNNCYSIVTEVQQTIQRGKIGEGSG